MARHFLDPSWMAGSFSLQQWPGTNYVFWTITGLGLKVFTLEQFAFIARMVNYLLYSIPLSKIFKKLEFGNLAMILLIQVLFLKQEYMAGEWIWKGFEGKTLAYIFIFWSILKVYESKLLHASILAAVATYCHVLVGGWFFIGIFGYMIWTEGLSQKTLRSVLIYTIITAPFIGFLVIHLLGGEIIQHEPSADWIYVFYRNAHHLVPTMKSRFWEHNWMYIILMICVVFGALLFKAKDKDIKITSRLAAVFSTIILVAIVVSYVDQNGVFLKYYLFRMTTIVLFFTLILFVLLVNGKFNFFNHAFGICITAILCILLIFTGAKRNMKNWLPDERLANYAEFVKFVRDHSSPADRFLFVGYNDKNENVQFIADTNRDRVVSYKMVPEGDDAIIHWYKRIKEREQFKQQPTLSSPIITNYGVTHVVSKNPLDLKIDPLFSNSNYYVYLVTTN